MMAVGVASPSAHGQATISTATALIMAAGAPPGPGAKNSHTPNVISAASKTPTVK